MSTTENNPNHRDRGDRAGRRRRHPDEIGHPEGAAPARWAQHCSRTPCTRSTRWPRPTSWSSSDTAVSWSAPRWPRSPRGAGAPIGTAVQEEQLGTGHAVGVGLTGLPADFAGTVFVTTAVVPLLDGPTADRVGGRARGRRGDRADTTVADPNRLRAHHPRCRRRAVTAIVEHADADEAQRAIAEINSGVYAFDTAQLRAALTRLRTGQRPGRAVSHRRDRTDPRCRTAGAAPSTSPTHLVCRRQRPGAAGRAGRRAEPAHHRPPPARRGDRHRTRAPPGSTSTWRFRPGHRHRAGHQLLGGHQHRRQLHHRPRHHADLDGRSASAPPCSARTVSCR